MSTAACQAEARFFHVALGRPSAHSHRLLRRAGLGEVLGYLGGDHAVVPRRLQVPRTLESLEVEYLAAFEVGAPHAPVPLNESHWIPRPTSQVLAENARFYGAFDMKLAPGGELPDHLTSQLAFVEYLLWLLGSRESLGLPVDDQRWALGDVVALHLASWVPAAAAAAREHRLRPIFPALLGALAGWLSRLAAEFPAGVPHPAGRPDRDTHAAPDPALPPRPGDNTT